MTYRATSPTPATKKIKNVVVMVQEGPAPAGTTKHWNLQLEIPPIPPSNLVNCNIIDLDYDFKVRLTYCTNSELHKYVFIKHNKNLVSMLLIKLI